MSQPVRPIIRTTNRPVTAPPETPTLRRGRKEPKPRRMAFVAGEDMTPFVPALEHARHDDPRPDILVWCGNHPERRMIREDVNRAALAGWAVSNYRSEMRSATFARDGYKLDVRSSAVWFGAESDPRVIHDAWHELAACLRGGFGAWAYLWPTPTLTGQELLRGTLPYRVDYPTLPLGLLELLLNTNLGGRTEVMTAPSGINRNIAWLPQLYNLDMRWSYASCLHGLPVGPAEHDTLARHTNGGKPLDLKTVGYQPSFYKFVAVVPDDWRRIGLLPCREGGETHYPHTPGARFMGWATGAEIQVALTYGWQVFASQIIHWPQMGRHDLMRDWISTLRLLREQAQRRAGRGDRLAGLIAAALRNIVVHTVGGFNRVSRISEGYIPYGPGAENDIPTGAIPLPTQTGWVWRRDTLQVDEWSHPEWFGTVTGRVRAKAARKALSLPPETVVSIRTDGILTTAQPTAPLDLGKPGDWRIKWHLPYALPAPRDTADVLGIIEQATNEYGANDTDHQELEGE